MFTHINSFTYAVKRERVGARKQAMHDARVESGLTDRIDWILANRRDPEGKPLNPSSLALMCGLSRATIHVIFDRKKKGNLRSADPETLEKIAKTMRVSYEWLARGVGKPEDAPGSGTSPLEAALLYHPTRWSEPAIQAARAAYAAALPEDRARSPLEWERTLDQFDIALKDQSKVVAKVTPAEIAADRARREASSKGKKKVKGSS